MSRKLIWSRPAIRDLQRMDRQAAQRVRLAMRRFAETEHGDVKLLQGREREWRLRVGDWRVIFEFDDAAQAILVLHILPRGRAYRD